MHPVSCPGVPQRAVGNLGVLVLGDGLLSLFSCVCIVMYLSVCEFVHMSAGVQGQMYWGFSLLKLELQMIGSHLM